MTTSNGKNSCSVKNVANCLVFDQTGENDCITCNSNYYVDTDGSCTAVNPPISNCNWNPTSDTCGRCNEGYGLAHNKKSCIDQGEFDSNCLVLDVPENMSCSHCVDGYYKLDGICVPFDSMPTGCLQVNIEDETECLVCRPGYWMDSDLECNQVKVVEPPNPEPSGEKDSVGTYFGAFYFILFYFF